MLIKDLKNCTEFIAGDDTTFRELLNGNTENLDIRYSLGEAILPPKKISQPHALKTSEVYFILQGKGMMHINEEKQEVSAGQVIYIPPHGKQFIENIGDSDLKFLCIVDPAWKKEDEEII